MMGMPCRAGFGFTVGFAVLLALFAGACSKNNNPKPTGPQVTPPARPTGLYASSTSPEQIVLHWRDNSDNEVGFRVQRRTSDEAAFATLGDTVAANVGTYSDTTGIQSGLTYVYRVLSYIIGVESATSDEVTVQAVTNASPTMPANPSPVDGAVEVDPTQPVQASWASSDADGDPVTYDVYYGLTLDTMNPVSTGQTEASYTFAGPFDRNGHYYWRVVAHDPKGVSSPSRIWGFNTVADRILVPAGKFFMGDTLETLPDSSPNPLYYPNNPVDVPDFNMDKYEVTNQQFADFLNQMLVRKEVRVSAGNVTDGSAEHRWAMIYPLDLDSDISFSVQDSAFSVLAGREKFPVVQVSWYGADAYARFYGRRLPTEQQWEKAARGTSSDLGARVFGEETIGIGFPFPWGAQFDMNRANVFDSGDPYENQGRVRTTPTGFYDTQGEPQAVHSGYTVRPGASPYGVEDMCGNVWEWTAEFYRGPYSDPIEEPHFGVLRGGSCTLPYGSAVNWNRTYVDPETCDRAMGFRTVSAP